MKVWIYRLSGIAAGLAFGLLVERLAPSQAVEALVLLALAAAWVAVRRSRL